MGSLKSIVFLMAKLINSNKDSKVMYYHDIGTQYTDMGTEFELFKKHIEIIKGEGYKIVPEISKREKEVMICFDDGWKGIYDIKDFFVQNGIRPTVFIAVSLIGQEGYLTVNQIKELETLGFLFECHTWSHKGLPDYNDEELVRELKGSKVELEKQFGHPFNSICYPQGRFSQHIIQLCKQYGFTKQYSSINGGYHDLADKGVICRNCMQYSSPEEFSRVLNSTSIIYRKKLIKQHVAGGLD